MSATWYNLLPRDVGVVVVAAGSGSRAGPGDRKQFRTLAGIPLLLHAVNTFRRHSEVDALVIALPTDVVNAPPEWLARLLDDRITMVAGGKTRRDSTRAGLDALPVECKTVLIHDGARPLIDEEIVDSVIAMARTGVGAVPAVPVTETLKRAAANKIITATVPRDDLWRAQTPQGFPRDMLESAFRSDCQDATDESQMVERSGGQVKIVMGKASNIKVTEPGDFAIAEAILASQS